MPRTKKKTPDILTDTIHFAAQRLPGRRALRARCGEALRQGLRVSTVFSQVTCLDCRFAVEHGDPAQARARGGRRKATTTVMAEGR